MKAIAKNPIWPNVYTLAKCHPNSAKIGVTKEISMVVVRMYVVWFSPGERRRVVPGHGVLVVGRGCARALLPQQADVHAASGEMSFQLFLFIF